MPVSCGPCADRKKKCRVETHTPQQKRTFDDDEKNLVESERIGRPSTTKHVGGNQPKDRKKEEKIMYPLPEKPTAGDTNQKTTKTGKGY